jgi:hypothetical protein
MTESKRDVSENDEGEIKRMTKMWKEKKNSRERESVFFSYYAYKVPET